MEDNEANFVLAKTLRFGVLDETATVQEQDNTEVVKQKNKRYTRPKKLDKRNTFRKQGLKLNKSIKMIIESRITISKRNRQLLMAMQGVRCV